MTDDELLEIETRPAGWIEDGTTVPTLIAEIRRLTAECDARTSTMEAMARAPASAWEADVAEAEKALVDGKDVVSMEELLHRARDAVRVYETSRGGDTYVAKLLGSLTRAVGILHRRSDELAQVSAGLEACAEGFRRQAERAEADLAREWRTRRGAIDDAVRREQMVCANLCNVRRNAMAGWSAGAAACEGDIRARIKEST